MKFNFTLQYRAGNHNTICPELAQLILRKGHNYAGSLAYSQSGPHAYRCLGWRDHDAVVRHVEPNVKKTFGDKIWSKLAGKTTSTSAHRSVAIPITITLKLYLFLTLPPQ